MPTEALLQIIFSAKLDSKTQAALWNRFFKSCEPLCAVNRFTLTKGLFFFRRLAVSFYVLSRVREHFSYLHKYVSFKKLSAIILLIDERKRNLRLNQCADSIKKSFEQFNVHNFSFHYLQITVLTCNGALPIPIAINDFYARVKACIRNSDGSGQ